MTVAIKILQRGDEDILRHVAPEVFDNSIDDRLATEFLADPRHHIAVAISGGLVVGFSSGVHYIHPDKPSEMWINEVAIAPQFRGRGIGKAVLQALLELARALHCKQAWVLTYRNNPAAMALYSTLGGTEGADTSGPADAMLGYTFNLADTPK